MVHFRRTYNTSMIEPAVYIISLHFHQKNVFYDRLKNGNRMVGVLSPIFFYTFRLRASVVVDTEKKACTKSNVFKPNSL